MPFAASPCLSQLWQLPTPKGSNPCAETFLQPLTVPPCPKPSQSKSPMVPPPPCPRCMCTSNLKILLPSAVHLEERLTVSQSVS